MKACRILIGVIVAVVMSIGLAGCGIGSSELAPESSAAPDTESSPESSIVGEWKSTQYSTSGKSGLEPIDDRFEVVVEDSGSAELLTFGEPFWSGDWFYSEANNSTSTDMGQENAAAGVTVFGVNLDGNLYMAQVSEIDGIPTMVLSGVDDDVENIIFVLVKSS